MNLFVIISITSTYYHVSSYKEIEIFLVFFFTKEQMYDKRKEHCEIIAVF